LPFNKVFF